MENVISIAIAIWICYTSIYTVSDKFVKFIRFIRAKKKAVITEPIIEQTEQEVITNEQL